MPASNSCSGAGTRRSTGSRGDEALRVVLQRVKEASVSVGGERLCSIGKGLLALVGVEDGDSEADSDYIASKISGLRIFLDGDGKMNLTCTEAGGECLAISQFTLHGDARKGRRPSFIKAARSELAGPLMETLLEKIKGTGLAVGTGRFGAHMQVSLINDGPVTILLDSRKVF